MPSFFRPGQARKGVFFSPLGKKFTEQVSGNQDEFTGKKRLVAGAAGHKYIEVGKNEKAVSLPCRKTVFSNTIQAGMQLFIAYLSP